MDKTTDKIKKFQTLEEALNFIESLKAGKKTGYLTVQGWMVYWK